MLGCTVAKIEAIHCIQQASEWSLKCALAVASGGGVHGIRTEMNAWLTLSFNDASCSFRLGLHQAGVIRASRTECLQKLPQSTA